jgi:hypothetical protein
MQRIARRRFLVLSTLYSAVALAAIVSGGGCTPVSSGPRRQEPSLAAQATEVRSGSSDRILVEQTALHDGDLQVLAGLANLRVLQLDHAQSNFTPAGLKQLASLTQLKHLRIRGTGIDDAALTELAQLKGLQILNIPQAAATDAGLKQLESLPELVQLRLGGPNFTDLGIKTIAGLPALKRLHLIDIPITNAGLKELAQMAQLESLYVDGGNFSDEAIDDLFRARPDLHVHFNQQHHDRDPHKHD